MESDDIYYTVAGSKEFSAVSEAVRAGYSEEDLARNSVLRGRFQARADEKNAILERVVIAVDYSYADIDKEKLKQEIIATYKSHRGDIMDRLLQLLNDDDMLVSAQAIKGSEQREAFFDAVVEKIAAAHQYHYSPRYLHKSIDKVLNDVRPKDVDAQTITVAKNIKDAVGDAGISLSSDITVDVIKGLLVPKVVDNAPEPKKKISRGIIKKHHSEDFEQLRRNSPKEKKRHIYNKVRLMLNERALVDSSLSSGDRESPVNFLLYPKQRERNQQSFTDFLIEELRDYLDMVGGNKEISLKTFTVCWKQAEAQQIQSEKSFVNKAREFKKTAPKEKKIADKRAGNNSPYNYRISFQKQAASISDNVSSGVGFLNRSHDQRSASSSCGVYVDLALNKGQTQTTSSYSR